MRIAVQPCSNEVAYQHYQDTIQQLVPRKRIEPFLTPAQRKEFDKISDDNLAVWGVVPGKKDVNLKKWEKLKSGDIAVLYRKRQLFLQAHISLCIRNRELAEELWSTNEDGSTWECVYFIDELHEIDISIEEYAAALGYKSNFIIQGFDVLEDQNKVLSMIYLLGIDDFKTVAQEIKEKTFNMEKTIERLSKLAETNRKTEVNARKEMHLHRSILFENKIVDKCDFCQKILPVQLLVTAHIKPRKHCTDKERKDPEIVMRACKLGCDELYERGYIHVDSDVYIRAG